MAGFRVEGNTSGNVAEVDVNNKLLVNTPTGAANIPLSGYSVILAEADAGEVTGTPLRYQPECTADYRMRVGQDNMLFNEQFPGTAFNTGLWTQVVSTMTTTVLSGFANLNAGLSVASGAVARLQTYRHFPVYKTYTTYVEAEVQFTQTPQTNNVCEWGFFISTGVAAPTDGAFFRLTSSGLFHAVLVNNSVETTAVITNFATLVGVNTTKQFLIYAASKTTKFWIDNVLVAEIPTPTGQGSSVASMNLPMAFRNYNTGVTSAAQVMKVGNTNVSLGDQAMAKPWGHIVSGAGGSSTQGQTGGTMGSTAIYTNSAAAAAAALSNTTPGAGSIGLGGIVNVLPTLVAGTDGILFSYQVPLGTAAQPGKSLYITGVTNASVVSTVLVGGPVIYAISLAYGHTAVSLATTESATTKAPRRTGLGIQSYAAAAAVATAQTAIFHNFNASVIIVQPGEFVQVVLRNIGAVTSSGVITFVVSFNGYFE